MSEIFTEHLYYLFTKTNPDVKSYKIYLKNEVSLTKETEKKLNNFRQDNQILKENLKKCEEELKKFKSANEKLVKNNSILIKKNNRLDDENKKLKSSKSEYSNALRSIANNDIVIPITEPDSKKLYPYLQDSRDLYSVSPSAPNISSFEEPPSYDSIQN